MKLELLFQQRVKKSKTDFLGKGKGLLTPDPSETWFWNLNLVSVGR